MADKVLALVRYYAREGHARQLQTICGEALRKRPGDPVMQFWQAVGMLMEGSVPEVRQHRSECFIQGWQSPGWTERVVPVSLPIQSLQRT
jgi:hypothetical protein